MYDKQNLPPIISDSDGHLRPKPEGTVAVTTAPIDTTWPYPANWGMDQGATMDVKAGQKVVCLGANDSYLNKEHDRTSTILGNLDPNEDERAAELVRLWAERDVKEIEVFESKKTVGLTVIGTVAPEAVGQQIQTPEGPAELSEGDVVVVCPRSGDLYRITPANRKKRYAEDGKVFEGDLPDELR